MGKNYSHNKIEKLKYMSYKSIYKLCTYLLLQLIIY